MIKIKKILSIILVLTGLGFLLSYYSESYEYFIENPEEAARKVKRCDARMERQLFGGGSILGIFENYSTCGDARKAVKEHEKERLKPHVEKLVKLSVDDFMDYGVKCSEEKSKSDWCIALRSIYSEVRSREFNRLLADSSLEEIKLIKDNVCTSVRDETDYCMLVMDVYVRKYRTILYNGFESDHDFMTVKQLKEIRDEFSCLSYRKGRSICRQVHREIEKQLVSEFEKMALSGEASQEQLLSIQDGQYCSEVRLDSQYCKSVRQKLNNDAPPNQK